MREACQKSMFERFFPSLDSLALSLSPVGHLTRARHTERLSIQIEELRDGAAAKKDGILSSFLSLLSGRTHI